MNTSEKNPNNYLPNVPLPSLKGDSLPITGFHNSGFVDSTNSSYQTKQTREDNSFEANKPRESELWDNFQKLCISTSMHGVGRIFIDRQQRFYKSPRRIVWCLAVFLCIGLSMYEVSSAVADFIRFPVNTVVRLNYPPDMMFPAVTICNNNQIRRSWLVNSQWLPVVMAYSGLPGEPVKPINWSLYNWTGFGFDKLMYEAGHQLDQMLFLCRWKGSPCLPEHFTRDATYLGPCHTFNMNQNLKVTASGAENALQMVFNIQQEEYIGNLRSGAGIRIIFGESHEPPSTERFAIALQPGTQTLVPLDVKKITNLPHPYGQCQERNNLTMFDHYSVPACVFECRAKLAAQKCGCREMYPSRIKTDTPICLPMDYRDCLNSLLVEISAKGSCSRCASPCVSTRYVPRMSYSQYPANHIAAIMADRMGVNTSYIRENFLEVNIYFEEIKYESMEETAAYTLASLIGVIGGHLGVFMGVSVLTMMEFAEFIVAQCTKLTKKTK